MVTADFNEDPANFDHHGWELLPAHGFIRYFPPTSAEVLLVANMIGGEIIPLTPDVGLQYL